MPASSANDRPISVDAPAPGWSALRRWVAHRAPSFTLARALAHGDEAFLNAWRYRLVNHRPYSDASRRDLARYDGEGFTPLQQAVRHGRGDLAALVVHFADANGPLQLTQDGRRLLALAPDEATHEVVQGFLKTGLAQAIKATYVAFLTDDERPPIRAHQRALGMVPWLLAGADPQEGLGTFVTHRMVHPVRVLLEHGADPHRAFPDRHDTHPTRTPYLLAQQINAPEILALFERHVALQLERVVQEALTGTQERPVPRVRARL